MGYQSTGSHSRGPAHSSPVASTIINPPLIPVISLCTSVVRSCHMHYVIIIMICYASIVAYPYFVTGLIDVVLYVLILFMGSAWR